MLLHLRKSERLKVEAYIGLLIAIITLALPMAWSLKTVLVFVLAGMAVHLIFSAPITIGFKTLSKVGMSVAAVAIIAGITWIQIPEQYLNDRMRSFDSKPAAEKPFRSEPKQPITTKIVQELKKIPGLISGSAKTDERLKSDTASLVKQLREFQKKVGDWHSTVASRLNQNVKNENSNGESGKLYIERVKELSASMATLDRQFNSELKPQVIALRNQLLSRLPPESVPAKPTVDWTLNYGFSTFPNAIGDIADYLESLAGMLPEK